MSRMSLLLHKSEVKLRTSVNNNDLLQVQWDITFLYPKGLSQSVLLCGITGNGFYSYKMYTTEVIQGK